MSLTSPLAVPPATGASFAGPPAAGAAGAAGCCRLVAVAVVVPAARQREHQGHDRGHQDPDEHRRAEAALALRAGLDRRRGRRLRLRLGLGLGVPGRQRLMVGFALIPPPRTGEVAHVVDEGADLLARRGAEVHREENQRVRAGDPHLDDLGAEDARDVLVGHVADQRQLHERPGLGVQRGECDFDPIRVHG